MTSFKVPSFQDRAALAKQAKQKALEKLKAKPQVDEATLAERKAARLAREAAEAEERAARRAADAAARVEREARRLEAATAVAAEPPALSEADKKAARDARYAARKKRVKR